MKARGDAPSSVGAGGVAVPKVFALAVSVPFRCSKSVASVSNAFDVAVAVVVAVSAAPCGHLRFLGFYRKYLRERAALAWAEAVTRITEGHVPEHRFEGVCSHCNERELSDLTLASFPARTNRLHVPK